MRMGDIGVCGLSSAATTRVIRLIIIGEIVRDRVLHTKLEEGKMSRISHSCIHSNTRTDPIHIRHELFLTVTICIAAGSSDAACNWT